MRLAQRGVQVRKITDRLIATDYKEFNKAPARKYYNLDMRPLAERDSIDELILLVVQNWGTLPSNSFFMTLEEPEAFCTIKGYVINLNDNSLEWRAVFRGKDYEVEIDDVWDQPPDFPNVTNAVNEAAAEAKARLIRDFFGDEK